MKVLHQVHPSDFKKYTTSEIREKFLLEGLLQRGQITMTYTHYDRMMVGAAYPSEQELELGTYDELRSEFFLERRELGIVCVSGSGSVTADEQIFNMEKSDCLYLGMGTRKVAFRGKGTESPKFVLFSCPAHHSYPARQMKPDEASPAELGSLENNNHRVINKYIHAGGIQSCQLVLGVTHFKKGSIWNTMPPHTHDRRMEAYFYFDLAEGQRIVHFMGEPTETRHIFMNNEEAVISPSWSIHSGVATGNYSFIWAMAGENKAFTDMDAVNISELK